jgi:hypothetical protein
MIECANRSRGKTLESNKEKERLIDRTAATVSAPAWAASNARSWPRIA